MHGNRAARRAARRAHPATPPGPCGWSIELVAYGASVGLMLDPKLNHHSEAAASVLLRVLLVALIDGGAERGWWPRPASWAWAPPPPADLLHWEHIELDDVPTTVLTFGGGRAIFSGPGRVALQLMGSLFNGLADGSAHPTQRWDTGGYDEQNLVPMARGEGAA